LVVVFIDVVNHVHLKKDFRFVYLLILQFAFLAPISSFLQLIGNALQSNRYLRITKGIGLLSSFLCIYGLFSLLRVSAFVLRSHRSHGKFFSIKGAVFAGVIPSGISTFLNLKAINDVYTTDVMEEAYASFVTIMLLAPLSYYITKYFDSSDCEAARIIARERTRDAFIVLYDEERKSKATRQFTIELPVTALSDSIHTDSKPMV